MLSKVFAAAAVAVVSAADVPVFSSNDDYDEINLNIRMLQNTTGGATAAPVATSISGGCSLMQVGANTCGNAVTQALHEAAVNTAVAGEYGASVSDSTTSATCGRRLSAAGRRLQAYTDSTTPYSQAYTYTVTFASAAAAAAAVSSFSTTSMNSALESANLPGATVNSATSTAPGVVVPAATPASPSPSPSSNAAKVAVSTLAAFSAFMASMM